MTFVTLPRGEEEAFADDADVSAPDFGFFDCFDSFEARFPDGAPSSNFDARAAASASAPRLPRPR